MPVACGCASRLTRYSPGAALVRLCLPNTILQKKKIFSSQEAARLRTQHIPESSGNHSFLIQCTEREVG